LFPDIFLEPALGDGIGGWEEAGLAVKGLEAGVGVSALIRLADILRRRHKALEALHQQRVDIIADTGEFEAGARVTGGEGIECPACARRHAHFRLAARQLLQQVAQSCSAGIDVAAGTQVSR
jgi:hypothetical protein